MKTGKIFVLICLITVILMSSAFSVSAEETDWANVDLTQVDWNQVDWENTDIDAVLCQLLSYDNAYEFVDFTAWMNDEAQLSDVILIYSHSKDISAQKAGFALYRHFRRDPYAWIQTVTQVEDEAFRGAIIGAMCHNAVSTDFSQVLDSVQLPETATEAEALVWAEILHTAEMEPDWANMDWNQVQWDEIDWDSINVSNMLREMYRYMFQQQDLSLFNDLCDWLETEGELYQVFLAKLGSDGYMSQSLSTVLYRRFAADPYYMIQAIALEDGYTQFILTGAISYGMSKPDEFSQVLGSVELPDTATDAERAVWAAILREAEEDWNVVPTGDTIAIPAALLLASTLGLALLISKKRIFV